MQTTLHSASVSPLARSLDRLDDLGGARSRLVFCEQMAQALTSWLPGLELGPWPGVAGMEPHGPRFSVQLRSSCAELWLQLPTAIDTVCAALLNAGSWSPAVRLRCLHARAQATLGELVRFIGALGLHPVQLDMQPAPLAPVEGATMFSGRLGVHRIDGRLHTRDERWLAALDGVTRRRPMEWLSRMSTLTVPLRARLGKRRLTLGRLHSLDAGDVVLLDGYLKGAPPVWPTLLLAGARSGQGTLHRACHLNGTELVITGDHWMNGETTEPAQRASTAEAAVALGDVEIDLHFELQVLSTPLSELASMRPGYVVELPVPAGDAVVGLVAGGQLLGRAQLVSVGDRLGARILEIYHADR